MRTKPSFTARDFVFIADILASQKRYMNEGAAAQLRLAFAAALRGTNPAFDTDRFLDAAAGMPRSRRDVAA